MSGYDGGRKARSPKRSRTLALALAGVALVLAVGCSSSPAPKGIVTKLPPLSAASTVPAPTTSTTTPQQAVIADFIAAQEAYQQALLTMNPNYPGLATTTTGAERGQVIGLISNLKAGGVTARGQGNLTQAAANATLVSYTPQRAVVHSCFATNLIAYGSDGKPLPTSLGQPGNVDITAVLVPQAGTWAVQSSTTTGRTSCAA